MLVAFAGFGIDEMHGREIAFAAFRGGDTALASERDLARGKTLLRERVQDRVERDAMAAHDEEIGRVRGLADQRYFRMRAGIERVRERIDLDEAVGFRKARDRTGALVRGKRDQA